MKAIPQSIRYIFSLIYFAVRTDTLHDIQEAHMQMMLDSAKLIL